MVALGTRDSSIRESKTGRSILAQNFGKYYQIFKPFHRQTQQWLRNETVIKDLTTPYTHRYTTSWNLSVKNWSH